MFSANIIHSKGLEKEFGFLKITFFNKKYRKEVP